ncbi:hypothetical protein AB6A40_001571 [Gnathostoma spinigerum]|uniref:long-chain-fatty-acid--CoA ligase n=1 Tax=Gnathostoma spinigerum TaxID=75299 RepID=A0ABD6E6J3_9BILA
MFDEYLFAKIRDVFGGRIKVMVVGGAPIAAPVMDFTRATIGAYVISGYGQTESSGLCSLTIECDSDPTVIGSPVHCNYVKLFPVPDLGYDDPEKQGGEICIKGPNVFKGYYKNETITKEVLGEDGWLHTGDIGKWTKSGTIQIIDRVKNIFKLSQGEYIAPEKVENFYAGSKLVSQVFVYGESLKTCLIAIVVPDEEELPRVVEEKLHLKNIPFKDLCSNSLVRKMVMEDMIEVGKESGLFPFEQVKDIFLSDEPFSTENQLLTPTMKNRRGLLKKRYEKELQEMYAKLP